MEITTWCLQVALCIACVLNFDFTAGVSWLFEKKRQGATSLFLCGICGEQKTQSEFADSQMRNKSRLNRTMRCYTCSHPPCIAPHCKTCRVCRDPECKKRRCQKEITALHPKTMPPDLSAVQSFLCDRCRYITCRGKKSEGGICGKEMPKRKQAQALASRNIEYLCGDCLTLQMNRDTLAKNRAQG